MTSRSLIVPTLMLALAAGGAWAQDTRVIQNENVRYVYAQVLRVVPVYQTLTATRVEQHCDQTPAPADRHSQLSRVAGVVRGALGRDPIGEESEVVVAGGCRSVPVEREFRRPIAYDVDYVYQGAKYRSRLSEDPGNRLRIRVGVTPAVSDPRSR